MTNNDSADWTKNLGHNFRALAKGAAGFYETERQSARRERKSDNAR